MSFFFKFKFEFKCQIVKTNDWTYFLIPSELFSIKIIIKELKKLIKKWFTDAKLYDINGGTVLRGIKVHGH